MKPSFTEAELALLLRQDLNSFNIAAFHELNPGTPYQHNWHHDLLASRLTAFARGEIRRLVIMLPPRSLKSHFASICLPAWLLGLDPTKRIVCASYSAELAEFLARHCLKLMRSPLYGLVFPQTRLSAQRCAVSEFMTTQQGMRLAASVGGTLTGKGGDFLIIDDPLKPEDALSDSVRRSANDWYSSTALTRLNDKAKGGVLIIMQRLHEDDLAGVVMQQVGWTVVRLPAIAEADEHHEWDNLLGPQQYVRRAGEALHPGRESLEVLAQIRAAQGEYHFAGQYQQNPAPLGGGLVKLAWFKRYEASLPNSFDLTVQSWDTASKESELASYSVCTTWGVKDKQIYLLDVLRERMEYPALKRAVHQRYEAFRPEHVLIEDKSSGTQLIQELQQEGLWGVVGIKPEGDKVMRLHAQTAAMEGGFVYVPESAPWLAEYLLELTTFPMSKHADQVDSTSQALAWLKARSFSSHAGLIQWMKDEIAKQGK